jgi:hypothetical protein
MAIKKKTHVDEHVENIDQIHMGQQSTSDAGDGVAGITQVDSRNTVGELERLRSAISEHKTMSWKLHGQHRSVDMRLYSALNENGKLE